MIQRGPTTPQMGYWRPNPSGRSAFWPHTASLLLAVLYFNTCIVETPCLGSKFPASRPHLVILEALKDRNDFLPQSSQRARRFYNQTLMTPSINRCMSKKRKTF